MIPASIRVLAAVRAGAQLVHRPRGVVHLYAGPLTPSGRFAAAAGRTVCRTRTRRLSVLEQARGPLELDGRRFCRRCTAALPPVLGAVVQTPVTREEWASTYAALTLDDFATALAWAGCGRDAAPDDWRRAAAATYTLGYLLSVVHGPKPFRRPADDTGARVFDLHTGIDRARRVFERNALAPEEREAAARAREAEDLDRLRVQRGRAREDRRARLIDRRNRGSYLTTWERHFLASTG